MSKLARVWCWIKVINKWIIILLAISVIGAGIISLLLDVVMWLFANHYCWSGGNGIIACGFNF